MYILEQTHGKEKFVFDYEDHNKSDLRYDVSKLTEELVSGMIDSFTVRWVKDE